MMYRRHHSHSHNSSNMSYNCGGTFAPTTSLRLRCFWINRLTVCFLPSTVSAQDGSYVQYVDSELYTTTTGQESSQMWEFFECFRQQKSYNKFLSFRSYPVYAVGDYAGGQQYYATTASNFTTSNGNASSNGNANSNSYIVPVDDAILGVAQSRGSPQTISTVSRLSFKRFVCSIELFLHKNKTFPSIFHLWSISPI